MKNAYKIRLTIAGIVIFLAILAIIGFYPFHFLDIQFSALLQRAIFDFSIFAIVLLSLVILSTLIFGRFYCSVLCPFGIMQEIANICYLKLKGKKLPNIEYKKINPMKYFIFAIFIGTMIGGSAILIRYIDPYTMFGSFVSHSIYGTIFTICVLILVFFKNRLFCTTICPVGTILGILSKFAPFKIYMTDDCIKCGMCARYCPSKCINKEEKIINSENCVKCLKCTSICPKNAIKYGLKFEKPKFNPNKRKALISIGAFTLFAGACALGAKFSNDLYKKIKKIILPPGALDIQRMGNKCLNCNLCIENCPNKILEKANSDFSAVHIDYTKGDHFCDYNCKKCSDICPSGAIKKLTIKEKQNLRIAMAYINQNCIGCSQCVSKCPRKAISILDGTAKINASKCIGCGACKAVCPMGAIDIFSTNKQTLI